MAEHPRGTWDRQKMHSWNWPSPAWEAQSILGQARLLTLLSPPGKERAAWEKKKGTRKGKEQNEAQGRRGTADR